MSRILENNMVTTKGPKVNVTIAKKYFLNKKKILIETHSLRSCGINNLTAKIAISENYITVITMA